MNKDCIFCKIVSHQIPSKLVYESSAVAAFHDINPQSPVHILIVPKKHIADINSLTENDSNLLGEIFTVARLLAKKNNLAGGYRLVINCGPDAGQSVDHLHFHLLGGRKLSWPPG